MSRGPEKIGRFLGAMIVIALCLLLSSCSTYRLATLNHDPVYGSEVVYLEVPEDTKVDTINSIFQLKRKLRTDFNFRWDFAQYAMSQPLSWYYNNPRLEGIWRPYNRFDVYFYSHYFWTNWAWDYNYYGWNSWYNWNRPWYYGWNRPYNPWSYSWYSGPWHNPGYNVVWNSSRRNNIAYINGPRGSRNNSIISRDNNIENTIVRRYNNPRVNVDNSNLNNIVNELRDNYGVKPRVYNNPNNVPNNNSKPIINNTKPSWNNSRPTYNNNNNFNSNSSTRSNNSFSPPPTSSNISRGSSTSSGGSSRGGNSRGNN